MGIINNRRPTLGAADRLKTSVYGLQRTQHPQHLQLLKSQTQCRAVDTEQIADIEPSDQRHKHLFAVHQQHHALKALFQNLRLVIGKRAGRIGMHRRLAVLRHHQTVLVIFVGHRKSLLLQTVKQPFLRVAVVVEGLVIINMIAREVREKRSVKIQSRNAFLRDSMTAHLHKRVLAPGIHHLPQ